jgi:hypothetical protein
MTGPDDADQVQQQPTGEQAAELAMLEGMVDQGAQPGAPGAPATATEEKEKLKPPSDQALVFALMIVKMVRPLAGHVLPALKGAPEDAWEPAIEGTAVLLDHYGVGGGEFAKTPWGRFVYGLGPLAGFAALAALTAPKDDKPADQVGEGGAVRLGAPDMAAKAPEAVIGSREFVVGAPV